MTPLSRAMWCVRYRCQTSFLEMAKKLRVDPSDLLDYESERKPMPWQLMEKVISVYKVPKSMAVYMRKVRSEGAHEYE